MKKIEYININVLHPHPDNPRKDLGDLTELADSIKAKGVLQNLTVVPDTKDGGYRIIIGHRRHAAAKLAGLTDLPCVIADMTPQEQFETMMVENVQRSDLTVYEQAEGFQMMLDMGSTVDEVAQKTGFSATTIRNRVKLTALDKDKFKKAEKRGATLSDYLKLNEIQDPETRNKVLDHIGTAEFNVRLKNALEEEAFQKRMEQVLNYFRNEQDWCRERTDEKQGWEVGQYSYYTSFDKWHKDDPKRPENADTVDYIWSVTSPGVITIYKENTASSKAPLSPDGQRRQKLKDDLEEIKNKLTNISKVHRELREDFIHDFTSDSTYDVEIMDFATRTMLYKCDGYCRPLDRDLLANLLKGSKDSKGNLDETSLNSRIFNRPQFALFCVAYTVLEGIGQKYHDTGSWITDVGFPPIYSKNPTLDLIYKSLVSMGYEMSEEEIQMQDGTHPLFQKAKDLIDAYKKEVE